MGKSPIVKEKVQQIWAYVLHIRQKKRSNGRMLEIMSINQCFPSYCIRLISMYINKTLEAILLSGIKKPIDRTFMVGFAVILVKILYEIISDDFT